MSGWENGDWEKVVAVLLILHNVARRRVIVVFGCGSWCYPACRAWKGFTYKSPWLPICPATKSVSVSFRLLTIRTRPKEDKFLYSRDASGPGSGTEWDTLNISWNLYKSAPINQVLLDDVDVLPSWGSSSKSRRYGQLVKVRTHTGCGRQHIHWQQPEDVLRGFRPPTHSSLFVWITNALENWFIKYCKKEKKR